MCENQILKSNTFLYGEVEMEDGGFNSHSLAFKLMVKFG
jgi:hypothetical protein